MKYATDRGVREENCVENARKRVLSQDSSAKWIALFHFVMFLVLFGASIFCGFAVFAMGARFQALGIQNIQWFGFAVGLLIGFVAGLLALKGALSLADAIKSIHGDLADQLLVEYHDRLVAILNNQEASMDSEID